MTVFTRNRSSSFFCPIVVGKTENRQPLRFYRKIFCLRVFAILKQKESLSTYVRIANRRPDSFVFVLRSRLSETVHQAKTAPDPDRFCLVLRSTSGCSLSWSEYSLAWLRECRGRRQMPLRSRF